MPQKAARATGVLVSSQLRSTWLAWQPEAACPADAYPAALWAVPAPPWKMAERQAVPDRQERSQRDVAARQRCHQAVVPARPHLALTRQRPQGQRRVACSWRVACAQRVADARSAWH